MGLRTVLVRTPVAISADYRPAFAALSQHRVEALVVSDDPENFTNRSVIVQLAQTAGVPAIYPCRQHCELGGLIAYAFDLSDLYRHAAHQADQILQGANPGEIPFYQSARFELVINLKTATAVGLTIPPTFTRARRRGDRMNTDTLFIGFGQPSPGGVLPLQTPSQRPSQRLGDGQRFHGDRPHHCRLPTQM